MIIISMLLTGGSINALILILSSLIGAVSGVLTGLFYWKNSHSFLDPPFTLDAGSLSINNNTKKPIRVTIGVANLSRSNKGVGRTAYVYKYKMIDVYKKYDISPSQNFTEGYLTNYPIGVYKEIIDTLKFASYYITTGNKNICFAWLNPFIFIFSVSSSNQVMAVVFKKMLKICKKLKREESTSIDEIEDWLKGI